MRSGLGADLPRHLLLQPLYPGQRAYRAAPRPLTPLTGHHLPGQPVFFLGSTAPGQSRGPPSHRRHPQTPHTASRTAPRPGPHGTCLRPPPPGGAYNGTEEGRGRVGPAGEGASPGRCGPESGGKRCEAAGWGPEEEALEAGRMLFPSPRPASPADAWLSPVAGPRLPPAPPSPPPPPLPRLEAESQRQRPPAGCARPAVGFRHGAPRVADASLDPTSHPLHTHPGANRRARPDVT